MELLQHFLYRLSIAVCIYLMFRHPDSPFPPIDLVILPCTPDSRHG